jgi:hypothetical protein
MYQQHPEQPEATDAHMQTSWMDTPEEVHKNVRGILLPISLGILVAIAILYMILSAWGTSAQEQTPLPTTVLATETVPLQAPPTSHVKPPSVGFAMLEEVELPSAKTASLAEITLTNPEAVPAHVETVYVIDGVTHDAVPIGDLPTYTGEVPLVKVGNNSRICGIAPMEIAMLTKEIGESLGIPFSESGPLIMSESSFRHYVQNPGGPCGIMLAGDDLGAPQLNRGWHPHPLHLMWDPRYALQKGLEYFRSCYNREGSWEGAVVCYKGRGKPHAYKIVADYKKKGGVAIQNSEGTSTWVSWNQ